MDHGFYYITMVGLGSPCYGTLGVPESIGRGVDDPLGVASYLQIVGRKS